MTQESGQAGDSPWATGDVPVPVGPPEFVWEQSSDRDATNSIAARPEATDSTRTVPSARPFWTKPRIIAPIAATALLLTAVVAWPRGNNSSDTPTLPIEEPSTDTATTTLDTLPEPETDDSGFDAGSAPDGSASGTLERVDLPPPVAAITQPTELLIQTIGGQLHTLSLPSGAVRTVDLSDSFARDGFGGFGETLASPDGVFLASYGGDPVIVPRAGPPKYVDVDQFATTSGEAPIQINGASWFRTTDGSTAFVVNVYDANGVGPTEYHVTIEGTATVATRDFSANYETPFIANGDRHINDAGGAYRIDADGTSTRISPGRIIAGSDRYLLLRECDESRTCRYSVVSSANTLDSRPIVDPAVLASLDNLGYGPALSPDGTAIATQTTTGSRVIVDLDVGPVATTAESLNSAGHLWAGDSSGTFSFDYDQGQLSFIDRRSGEETRFGDEFGMITALGVRHPESELVEETVAISSLKFSAQPSGPIGIDLVSTGTIGGMTLLDLDDASAMTWNAPTVPGTPPRLFSNGRQVVVVAANSNSGYIASVGTAWPLAADALPQEPLFAGPTPGEVWARNPEGDAPIDHVTVNPFGLPPSGTTLTLADGELLGSDSAGGMVVSSGGDIYTSSGNTVTKLTSGEILAIGASTAFVRECDESLVCNVIRVDRASGERAESAIGAATAVGFARTVSLEGSVSPDGGVILVETPLADGDDPDLETEWNLVDLASGVSVSVPEPLEGQPTVWNAQSSYAAIAIDDGIVLYERATASIIQVQGPEGLRCITAVGETFAS